MGVSHRPGTVGMGDGVATGPEPRRSMTLAQAAPGRLGARLRISSYSVWETAVFVVNVLAFVLMGLQARLIIERLSPEQRWGSLVFGLSVLAVVISAVSSPPTFKPNRTGIMPAIDMP